MWNCSSRAVADTSVQPMWHTQIVKGSFGSSFSKAPKTFLLLEHTQAGPVITTKAAALPNSDPAKITQRRREGGFSFTPQHFTHTPPEPQGSIFPAIIYNWKLIFSSIKRYAYTHGKIQKLHLQAQNTLTDKDRWIEKTKNAVFMPFLITMDGTKSGFLANATQYIPSFPLWFCQC